MLSVTKSICTIAWATLVMAAGPVFMAPPVWGQAGPVAFSTHPVTQGAGGCGWAGCVSGYAESGHYGHCGQGATCGQGVTCGQGGVCGQAGHACRPHGLFPGYLDHWCQKHDSYYQHVPYLPCPGDALNQSLEAQKLNGRLAQLVFHRFHFQHDGQTGTWNLTRSGWNRAYDLSRILPITPGSITVDPLGDPEADALRMQAVRDALAAYGIENMDLTLARPRVPGLDGPEALLIYGQRQQGSPLDNLRRSTQVGQGFAFPSAGGGQAGGNQQPR
jgi:hypothetical protein